MSDLPEPFVGDEVDLRKFPYMPLDVSRLRDSDFAALVSAEAFRAAVILWCAAWHQQPAASLPADDYALARLAGFGRDLSKWKKVRSGALRGFVLCSDNRLYHPVVAEKALNAWAGKKANHEKTAAATAARQAKREAEAKRTDRSGQRDVERHDQRDGDVTLTKREGEREENPSLRSGRAERAGGNAYARFKKIYPQGGEWHEDAVRRALDERVRQKVDIEDVLLGAKRFAEDCKATGRKLPTAAHHWLKGGGWKDWVRPASVFVAKQTTFVEVDDEDRWQRLAERWKLEKGTKLPRRAGGPKRKEGWDFPDEWIDDLSRSAA